tara:strand:- start:571 stop:774 length:204 start_codon:yes stop_codon:yes gene_type:complete
MIKPGQLVRIKKTAVQDSRHLEKVGILLKDNGVDDCGNPEVYILVDGDRILVYPDGYEVIDDQVSDL